MMKERTQLMDEKMNLVNGGNYGDTEKDNGDEPMYAVGQNIELYNTIFHVTTTQCTVYAAKKNDSSHWKYRITPDDPEDPIGMHEQWVYANDIERK